MAIVGVISDTHLPWAHPNYLRFCQDVFAKYKVTQTLHVGDLVDNHAVAPNYDADPSGLSVADEMSEALEDVARWHKVFPNTLICQGNHDARHVAAARKAGLTDRHLRDYAQIWGTPTWKWALSHEIAGVLYEHGTGSSGDGCALKRAISNRQSTVMGHTHTGAGINYHTNRKSIIFGLNVGCGIDVSAYAFEYGIDNVKRPVLGCGIVFDSETALFVAMKCGPGQRYHRSRS